MDPGLNLWPRAFRVVDTLDPGERKLPPCLRYWCYMMQNRPSCSVCQQRRRDQSCLYGHATFQTLKSKLTFQQLVGIDSGFNGALLQVQALRADTLRMIEYNCLLTYIGISTKIHLTLARMSLHGPDDY